MRKLIIKDLELIHGSGDECEATVTGIFAFGAAIVAIPGVGIVGGTAMVVSAGLWAFGGCGK